MSASMTEATYELVKRLCRDEGVPITEACDRAGTTLEAFRREWLARSGVEHKRPRAQAVTAMLKRYPFDDAIALAGLSLADWKVVDREHRMWRGRRRARERAAIGCTGGSTKDIPSRGVPLGPPP
jgi:hypothetical protein